MKKISLIIILLVFSHVIFFILIDRNREGVKSFLVENGLWKGDLYIYLQQKLTNKELKSKTKDQNFNNNLPENFNTNHFDAKRKVFDLEKILKDINKEVSLGYITSFEIVDKKIKIITNNGYLLILDKNFKIIKFIDFSKILNNFYTDYAYGGIRAAKWINSENFIIYSTIKDIDSYKISLISFKISKKFDLEIIDILDLGNLPKQDGTTSSLGGGIEFKDNVLYLSIGTTAVPNEFQINDLAQIENNNFGKILKIFIDENKKFKKINLIAKGSRNSQGLLIINKSLLSVEHGPQGGDEINHIKIDEYHNNILNFGWPNFSYGLPYHNEIPYADSELKNIENKNFEKFYNDKDNRYVKPIFYFTPSIAISHIASCPFYNTEYDQYKNCFIVSSLKDKSVYIIKYENINDNLIIKSTEKIFIGNRIRKIFTENNTLYACLDNLKIIKIDFEIFK